MLSQNPGISEEEKERLLHCVVIGGGRTGVEFSGEYCQRYTYVKNDVRVTLIEANEILSSFDVGLRQYASKHLTKSGVRLVRGVVKEVHPKKLVLSDGSNGSDVPCGLLVLSTGVGPSEFVKSLNLPKSQGGRIGIDEWLRVPSVEDVFALGDCAGCLEQTGKQVLPALSQGEELEPVNIDIDMAGKTYTPLNKHIEGISANAVIKMKRSITCPIKLGTCWGPFSSRWSSMKISTKGLG